MKRTIATLMTAATLLTACGGGSSGTSTSPSGPSGSLGVITAEEASAMVNVLCDLRSTTELDAADSLFFDRAHEALHVLAAATETVDRVASATLLQAKQRVESDLQGDALPTSFAVDVGALLTAVRAAMDTVQLPAPEC